jgi:hypothetical protein
VRGWDFKIIVGRVLGWNVLKSSRFDIARSGSNFVFRGSGFGHGLGLCQEGAHVMAARGGTYQRILEKYFPGTSLGKGNQVATRLRGDGGSDSADHFSSIGWKADLLLTDSPLPLGEGRGEGLATNPTHFELFWYPSGSEKRKESSFCYRWLATSLTPAISERQREQEIYEHFIPTELSKDSRILTISSEHFRVTYPANVDRRDANEVLNTLEAARSDFLRRAAAASVSANIPLLEIRLNESTGDFTSRTGQPWWAAAATKGHRIELQPVGLLKRRGVLTTTLRHEFAHVVIDGVSRNRAPRWLEEGFALYLAGEGQRISRYLTRNAHSTEELERRLARPGTQDEMRALYAEAYQKVLELIRQKGEAGVWVSL